MAAQDPRLKLKPNQKASLFQALDLIEVHWVATGFKGNPSVHLYPEYVKPDWAPQTVFHFILCEIPYFLANIEEIAWLVE
jgi:hypothetical protein